VGEDKGTQLALGLTWVLRGALTVAAEYAQDGSPPYTRTAALSRPGAFGALSGPYSARARPGTLRAGYSFFSPWAVRSLSTLSASISLSATPRITKNGWSSGFLKRYRYLRFWPLF